MSQLAMGRPSIFLVLVERLRKVPTLGIMFGVTVVEHGAAVLVVLQCMVPALWELSGFGSDVEHGTTVEVDAC